LYKKCLIRCLILLDELCGIENVVVNDEFWSVNSCEYGCNVYQGPKTRCCVMVNVRLGDICIY